MANITFDFSNESIVHPQGKATSFVFKDIGTANFRYKVDRVTKAESVIDTNSSNIDKDAVRASLNNILNFRSGDKILDPEFGIGRVYEMLYSPFDKYTTQKMIKTLKEIVASYEPRIEIISMPVAYDEDKQEFSITINYYIPALAMNDTYQIQLSH